MGSETLGTLGSGVPKYWALLVMGSEKIGMLGGGSLGNKGAVIRSF